MRRVFADASYFLAPIRGERERSRRIQALKPQLADAQFVTSYGVLSEVLARVARRGPHVRRAAASSVRAIFADADRFTVVYPTPALADRGLALYAARLDQRYSLEDCVSMAIMDELGIEVVLTFDSDFHGENRFTVLPAPTGIKPPRP